MARKSLFPKSESIGFQKAEGNPFSKKSSEVLFWLLTREMRFQEDDPLEFSINQIARELNSSPNLVFRVIKQLEFNGMIKTRGVGTSKKHWLSNPTPILEAWLNSYAIQKKAKIYQFRIFDPILFEKKIEGSEHFDVVPALHTAAQALFHSRASNLRSREYYILSSSPDKTLKMGLEPQSHGYDVLLIEPYYSTVVEYFAENYDSQQAADRMLLLTFLDLYNFPVRGIEQAETLFRRHSFFKKFGAFESLKPRTLE